MHPSVIVQTIIVELPYMYFHKNYYMCFFLFQTSTTTPCRKGNVLDGTTK